MDIFKDLEIIYNKGIIYLDYDSHDLLNESEINNSNKEKKLYENLFNHFLYMGIKDFKMTVKEFLKEYNTYINFFQFNKINGNLEVICIIEHDTPIEVKRACEIKS